MINLHTVDGVRAIFGTNTEMVVRIKNYLVNPRYWDDTGYMMRNYAGKDVSVRMVNPNTQQWASGFRFLFLDKKTGNIWSFKLEDIEDIDNIWMIELNNLLKGPK